MVSEKSCIDDYLTKKHAGFFGGLARGAQGGVGGATLQGAADHIGETMGRGAVGTAGAVAGTAAVALAAMGVHKLYDAATKTRDFNSMLEYAPDLAEMHAENPRQVNQMFSTLRMFNPDFTRDPVVSSSYVRRMVTEPMGAGGIATEALGHRSEMRHPLAEKVMGSAFGGEKKPKKK